MIRSELETRELITLGGDGVLLRGTYHKTTGKARLDANGLHKRMGVAFLNPLSTPRALIGDSAVYWASSFAAHGYPSFRLDLPGLGDTFGEVPNELITFINDGGYAAIASSKIKELTESFGLKGAVIYGHCAGGTTAVYAAAECKECKGLILTAPYFNAANLLTPKLSPEMIEWARRSKVGELIRASYARMRELRKKPGSGPLPGNAHLGLLSHWKKVLSNGLPILILKSAEPAALGSSKLRSSNFDYLGYIASFAVRSNQITIKTIEGTDHSFANRAGRAAVRLHTEAWLSEYFPQEGADSPLLQHQSLQDLEKFVN
jgi:pimeloyl-ACP methyl ester carboxylesterase